MKTLYLPFLIYCALLALIRTPATAEEKSRERIAFDDHWRFIRGDPPGTGDSLSYSKIKAWILPTANDVLGYASNKFVRPANEGPGREVAYTQPTYDDSRWRQLNLPHDWGIEGPFAQELSGETARLPWAGVGWYRKRFQLPESDRGRCLYLDVDGAMAYASVWLNGQLVGGWPYGYSSWRVDLNPFAKVGAENVLVIRVDNPPESSRWYPGSGIYRNVWLLKMAPVHVAHWGVRVTTPQITATSAQVYVETKIDNTAAPTAEIDVTTKLFELNPENGSRGTEVATGTPVVAVSPILPGKSGLICQSLEVLHPQLWSTASPRLYLAVTQVRSGGQIVDTVETTFGLRTITMTADRGFFLNGIHVPIQGVCLHHDLGALGTAINLRAMERQLEILRDMGCNAIRTGATPPAPEFLDLCDRMGFLVMDEAFDCWATGKKPNDYQRLFPEWHEADLRAFIRRDGNHPSVLFWSIGNELFEQRLSDGWQLAAHLAAIVREEDRTRPVTAGLHRTTSYYNGFQTVLDVVGFNYKPWEYGKFKQANPHIPVVGSETASTISSRGEYFFPIDDDTKAQADFQVSSFDLLATPWSKPAEAEFRGLDEFPFVIGEFVWTGFDYLGEPWPYGGDSAVLLNFTDPAQIAREAEEFKNRGKLHVPSRSSYFGIVDLAGFKKDRFYLYQSRWRPNLPMAHILPHWTWPERTGAVTPVHVYTSGDEAELFLNGQSLGRKKKGLFDYRLRWDDVKYVPGELRVVAYKNGRRWAEDVMRTSGAPEKLSLQADRFVLQPNGVDLAYVTVRVEDAKGVLVPRAKNLVAFELSGPADLVATDNGDATDFTSFQSPKRKAFNGLALAIVRTRRGQEGIITLKTTSDGVTEKEITLRSGSN